MTRFLLLIISLVLFASPALGAGTCWNGGSSGTAPWTVLDGSGGSPSAAYADINYCIGTVATAGDTVNVTATGAVTWGTNLSITKGISLIGPGMTEITITKGTASGYMISYNPATPALNSTFKIKGFKFDGDQKGSWLILEDVGNTNIQTNIVIIDNHVYNFSSQAIVAGKHRGVIAGNIFNGTNYPFRFTSGADAWSVLAGLTYGNADTMWIEDNAITGTGALIDCDSSNRYSMRYNTIVDTAVTYPIFDQHGDAPSGENCAYQSCFGAEIYGNNITMVAGQADFRGSKYLVYYNTISASSGFNGWGFRDEYCDCANACAGESTDSIPQYINDSYSFNSRLNLTGALKNFYSRGVADCQATCGYIVTENVHWFKQPETFNGTVGVGCGTAATMNAIETCTDGVGFWVPNATIDATAASCTDLTGYVGANNTIAASVEGNTGKLYKCASNEWVEFYTPYTYPHPLRLPEPEDAEAPVVTITTSDPSAITTDSLTTEGTATGSPSSCKFRVGSAPDADNGTACTGSESFTCNASGFTIGANTLYVGCGDLAGNWGSDSITVNYNRVKPIITLNVGPVWTLQ